MNDQTVDKIVLKAFNEFYDSAFEDVDNKDFNSAKSYIDAMELDLLNYHYIVSIETYSKMTTKFDDVLMFYYEEKIKYSEEKKNGKYEKKL